MIRNDECSIAPPVAPTESDRAEATPPQLGRKALQSAALLAVGYFVAASVRLILTRVDGTIAYCWMATAILMPFLTRLPTRRWAAPLAACAIASVIASSLFGAGPLAAVPFAVVLAGEAAIGVLLLRRVAADRRYFEDVPRLARFALLVGVVMPVIPAFGGAALSVVRFGMEFWPAWLVWYFMTSNCRYKCHSTTTRTRKQLGSLSI